MYFDDFRQYSDAQLNPRLLWEYNLSDIDYSVMKEVIVQRVIERGWPEDWYFILNRYGVEGVKQVILKLPYLNKKDMHFVSHQFSIPITSMKCYIKKRSVKPRWNS